LVSIHAPVKGATPHRAMPCIFSEVSIHAPVKGATLVAGIALFRVGVSIHAPVKGATEAIKDSLVSAMFQSTPP